MAIVDWEKWDKKACDLYYYKMNVFSRTNQPIDTVKSKNHIIVIHSIDGQNILGDPAQVGKDQAFRKNVGDLYRAMIPEQQLIFIGPKRGNGFPGGCVSS